MTCVTGGASMATTSCRKLSSSSSTESRLSDRKLKPLPDPFRHQDSAIALSTALAALLSACIGHNSDGLPLI